MFLVKNHWRTGGKYFMVTYIEQLKGSCGQAGEKTLKFK